MHLKLCFSKMPSCPVPLLVLKSHTWFHWVQFLNFWGVFGLLRAAFRKLLKRTKMAHRKWCSCAENTKTDANFISLKEEPRKVVEAFFGAKDVFLLPSTGSCHNTSLVWTLELLKSHELPLVGWLLGVLGDIHGGLHRYRRISRVLENTGKLELTSHTQSITCKFPPEQIDPGRSWLNPSFLTDESMIHVLGSIFSDVKNTTTDHQQLLVSVLQPFY